MDAIHYFAYFFVLCWKHSCIANETTRLPMLTNCRRLPLLLLLHHEGERQIDCKLAFFQALPMVCFIRRISLICQTVTYISNSICTTRSPRFLKTLMFLWSLFCSSLTFLHNHSLWCFHIDGSLSTTPRGNRENHHHLHQVPGTFIKNCSNFASNGPRRTGTALLEIYKSKKNMFLQGEGAEVQGADHDAHRLRVGLHEHQPWGLHRLRQVSHSSFLVLVSSYVHLFLHLFSVSLIHF